MARRTEYSRAGQGSGIKRKCQCRICKSRSRFTAEGFIRHIKQYHPDKA